jgi:putative SOS response-associated peptidase YedK
VFREPAQFLAALPMCTRFVLLKEHISEALASLGVEVGAVASSRYNIAPSTPVIAVRRRPSASLPEATALHWGLVPSWVRDRDTSAPIVNARAETLTAKPSFRDAFQYRRCIIPAGGFYEWAQHGRARKPWLFQRPDATVFGFAGLWETWRAPDGSVLESCAFVTTAPNAVMRPIHHRMPALLSPENFATWLDPDADPARDLAPLLRPAPDNAFTATALSSYVNNVRHDDSACLTPACPDDGDPAPQLSLGFD